MTRIPFLEFFPKSKHKKSWIANGICLGLGLEFCSTVCLSWDTSFSWQTAFALFVQPVPRCPLLPEIFLWVVSGLLGNLLTRDHLILTQESCALRTVVSHIQVVSTLAAFSVQSVSANFSFWFALRKIRMYSNSETKRSLTGRTICPYPNPK